jgi:hypothetical protein
MSPCLVVMARCTRLCSSCFTCRMLVLLSCLMRCSVTISVLGAIEKYEIEHELEFTSDRKRMSVVARVVDSKKCVCVLAAGTLHASRGHSVCASGESCSSRELMTPCYRGSHQGKTSVESSSRLMGTRKLACAR